MRRLIWGFAGQTYHIAQNLMLRLIYALKMHTQKRQRTTFDVNGGKIVKVKRCSLIKYSKKDSKEDQKWFFKADYPLMQVKSIAECFKGSILQYYRPSLSYHLSLISLFCLFLSGRLRQFLLYASVLGQKNRRFKKNVTTVQKNRGNTCTGSGKKR